MWILGLKGLMCSIDFFCIVSFLVIVKEEKVLCSEQYWLVERIEHSAIILFLLTTISFFPQEKIRSNYDAIKFRPEHFIDYLLSDSVGFATFEVLETPQHKATGN